MSFYHLTVSGSAKERGRKHGEAFRKPIHELAKIRSELIKGFLKSKSPEEITAIVQRQVGVFQSEAAKRGGVYRDLYEEFVGISEGSGLALLDLMVLNNYTDLRDFEFHHDEGCSTFAACDSSGMIAGQTWDMHASAEAFMLHLTHEAGNGIPKMDILTVTGCSALAGVNGEGVAVFVNNLHCNETRYGLSWPSLVRGMLSQRSAKAAYKFLQENMPSSGHNYLICDASEAIDIETTGRRFAEAGRIAPGKTPLQVLHTNHYLTELAEIEVASRRSQTTEKRLQTMKDYFSKHTVLPATLEKFSETFFSDPVICIPPPKEPHGSATNGGIAYDYRTKRGFVFKGSQWNREKREIGEN